MFENMRRFFSNNLLRHKANEPIRYRAIELNRGVSLMELLVYIALLSVILLVISNAFVSISKSGGSIDARTEVNSNARFASNKIKDDIRAASAISVPALAGDTSNTLSLTIGGDTILYDVSTGQLRRKVNAGTPEPMTSGLVVVSVPTFTRLENYNSALQATTTTIRFNITMNYNSAAPDYAYSEVISGSAGLR